MLARTSVLSDLIPCLISMEGSDTADSWFSSLVSVMHSKISVKMCRFIWPMNT